MGIVQLCSLSAISDVWLESLFVMGGGGLVLKITCPRYKEFLVVAYMNFLIMASKNEPQDLWKWLRTRLK